MIRLTGPNRGIVPAMSVSRSTHSNAPDTIAWRRIIIRSGSVPLNRPPSDGRRSVATHGHCLSGASRLKSTALARKSRRSSTNLAPRFTASASSATTILWRVRPITTSTRSDDITAPFGGNKSPNSKRQISNTKIHATPAGGERLSRKRRTRTVQPGFDLLLCLGCVVRDLSFPEGSHLAGFLVHDVPADDRVVLAERDALLGVVAVLLREVAVVARLALELDGAAGFLRLRHDWALGTGLCARPGAAGVDRNDSTRRADRGGGSDPPPGPLPAGRGRKSL